MRYHAINPRKKTSSVDRRLATPAKIISPVCKPMYIYCDVVARRADETSATVKTVRRLNKATNKLIQTKYRLNNVQKQEARDWLHGIEMRLYLQRGVSIRNNLNFIFLSFILKLYKASSIHIVLLLCYRMQNNQMQLNKSKPF